MTTQKKLESAKSKAVAKKYTPEETRKMLLEFATTETDLNRSLKIFGTEMLPKILNGSEKEKKEAMQKFNEKAVEILTTLETETHVGLMETFWSQYRGLAKEFSEQIIKDYNITANTEKALAEVIANAFIRIIDNSRRFNNELGNLEGGAVINENRTKYLTMLSKQIERANRQFITAFVTLKQIKSPTLEFNVKAKTAFISQNQQINANGSENSINSNTDENNEPK